MRVELMDEGEACLVDELGAVAMLTVPAHRGTTPQVGVRLDLGGKLNKLPDRYHGRFLLSFGQAAELMAELANAAISAGASDVLNAEFVAAINRLKEGR